MSLFSSLTTKLVCAALPLALSLSVGCRLDDGDGGDDPKVCPAIAFVCPDDTTEVDTCSPDGACTEYSQCDGSVVTCQQDDVVCTEVLPGCQPGYIEVQECPKDANCIIEDFCGQQLICAPDTSQCLAYPTCQPGYVQVPSCQPGGVECEEVSICGYTISCQLDVVCAFRTPAQPPSCPDGYYPDSCDPDEPDCIFSGGLCGPPGGITCRKNPDPCEPEAFVCPAGYDYADQCGPELPGSDCFPLESACSATPQQYCYKPAGPTTCTSGNVCRPGFAPVRGGCDTSLSSCYLEDCDRNARPTFCQSVAACLAEPVCPVGQVEVQDADGSCRASGQCSEVTRCAKTIVCGDQGPPPPLCQVVADKAVCSNGTKPLPLSMFGGPVVPKAFSDGCGDLLWCPSDQGIACEAYPSCGPDANEVNICTDAASCFYNEICGYTILCQDNP